MASVVKAAQEASEVHTKEDSEVNQEDSDGEPGIVSEVTRWIFAVVTSHGLVNNTITSQQVVYDPGITLCCGLYDANTFYVAIEGGARCLYELSRRY